MISQCLNEHQRKLFSSNHNCITATRIQDGIPVFSFCFRNKSNVNDPIDYIGGTMADSKNDRRRFGRKLSNTIKDMIMYSSNLNKSMLFYYLQMKEFSGLNMIF